MDPTDAAAAAPIINGEGHQSQIIGVHMDPNLFKAAAEGNIEPFKEKAPQHLELLVTQFKNNTILHINIRSQELETASTKFVEQILDICPSLLLKVNTDGDTPLHTALKCGHSTIAIVLIQHAKAGNGELESGLRPVWQMLRIRNNEKNTALHEATRHGNPTVVEIITKEADPNFSYSANDSDQTPLYLAAVRRSSNMVASILERCTSSAHEGPNGKTALHVAACYDDLEITKQILEKKKSLTIEADGYGWTPLHYAAYYDCFSVAKLLLENDISAAFVSNKDRKMTALHMAAGGGYKKIIELFLSYCPECCELLDHKGWNFLHYAVISLSPKEFMQLYNNYPLVRNLRNEKNFKGNTPLHLLVAFNRNSRGRRRLYKFHGMVFETVNNQNIRAKDLCHYGFLEIEQEIQELTEDTLCNEQYPKGIVYVPRVLLFKSLSDYIDLKKAKESYSVVAGLVATVSFTAAFTLPGGYESGTGENKGTATLIKNWKFQAFIVTDSLALVLSLWSVLVFLNMSSKIHQESVPLFGLGVYLLSGALGAMSAAFVTGMSAALETLPGLAVTPSLICSSITFIVLFIMAKLVYNGSMEVLGMRRRRF